MNNSQELLNLREEMSKHFSVLDINELYFRLGIDRESVSDETKNGLIRELILYCNRKGKLPELLEELEGERPDVDWEISGGVIQINEKYVLGEYIYKWLTASGVVITFFAGLLGLAADIEEISKLVNKLLLMITGG